MNWPNIRPIVVYCAALFSVTCVANVNLAAAQKAALVEIDKVQIQNVFQTIPVIGRLIATKTGPVATRVSGQVEKIEVLVGNRVTKGQVVALLVQDRLHWEYERRLADVDEQKAKLSVEESEMELKQQELERLEQLQLNNSSAFKQALYDDKQIEANILAGQTMEARARLKRATAHLKAADLDLKNATIRSPYGGVVTKKHVEIGTVVAAGEALITILDDQTMEIEADVPADRLTGLKPGQQVIVRVNGKSLSAHVRAIVPLENPLTRTRAVRFTPKKSGTENHFANNQSVTINIPLEADKNVVSVHKDAVLARANGHVVFILSNGKAFPRPIIIGEAVGERFIVTKGLKEGDIVAVRGNERLFPGQSVRF